MLKCKFTVRETHYFRYVLFVACKQIAYVTLKQHACFAVFPGQAVVSFMWDFSYEVSINVVKKPTDIVGVTVYHKTQPQIV